MFILQSTTNFSSSSLFFAETLLIC
jgi:hypothetical protein